MNKGPTKAQLESMYAFQTTSMTAGKFNVNPKYVQQLRRIIKEMGLNTEKLHQLIDAMEENKLL